MRVENKFVLIQGVEMVCRNGSWARVPTTILYTGNNSDFWEVVDLENRHSKEVVEVVMMKV